MTWHKHACVGLLTFVSGAAADHTLPVVGINSQAPGGGAGSGNYVYISHNGTPVISSAVVKFTSADLNHGTEPSSAVETYSRSLGDGYECNGLLDDAGHIYANQLGGLAEPINIFPQCPHINRGAYRTFETKIYDCMSTGGASSATLSWSFSYDGDSDTRPAGVTYSASFDAGCSSISQQFSNYYTKDDLLV